MVILILYIEFMKKYQIPYVAMVDSQYPGDNLPSDNFVKLKNELEDELKAVGWLRKEKQKAGPDDAYNLLYENIQQSQKEKIRNSKLGKIFDMVLQEIGLTPNDVWACRKRRVNRY